MNISVEFSFMKWGSAHDHGKESTDGAHEQQVVRGP